MTEKQEKTPRISALDPVFKLILDLSPVGFVIFDAEGRAIYANPMAEQLFGKMNKALEGLRCGDLMARTQGRAKPDACGPPESNPDCQPLRAVCTILEGGPQQAVQEGEAFLESVPDRPAVRVKYKVDGILLNGRKAAVLAIDDISELHQKEQSLFKSEQYFLRMFERAPLGYQSLDEQGRFIEVNEAWLETLGYQREEVIGKWFGDFLAPEYVASFRERFPLFKARGRIHSEFEMLHKNGSRRYIAFEGRVGYKQDGRFEKTHCILADVTDQKAAEKRLADHEHYLRTILQTTADGFWVVGADGKIVEVNEAYGRMSGYTRDELLKLGIADIDATGSEKIETRLRNVSVNGSEIFETRHRRKDGTLFDVEMSVTYLEVKGGQFICFCRDITERKRQEAALRENEARLKEAHEIARIGRWELDLKTDHLKWSEGIFRLFEVDSRNFAASYAAFLDFVYPHDRDKVDQAYRESIEQQEPYEIEHRLLMKDGRIKWVNEIGRTEYDALGNPIRSIGTVQEITARKQAEERERHLTKVLRAIRNVNQLIVSEDDPLRLIERACAELTRTMGYFSAWISLLKADRSTVATSGSGFEAAFDELRKHLESGAFCDCMRKALARDETIVVMAPQTHCPECPLSGHYGGMAAFGRRLAFDGKIYGFLSASLPVASADDAEEKGLFDELANDLAFALHKIESAKALRESQQDMKRAQSIVQIGSWRFDLASGMVIASDVTRRIYGLDNSEWTIKRVRNIPLPQYREALDAELQNLIHHGAPYNIEFQIQRPSDHAVRYIHSVAEYDAEQNIVIGTIQDITESKQAQDALKRIEARQRKMVANIGDVIVIIDQDGINRYKSPNIEKFFGWRPEEVVGVSAWENVHPEDLNAVLTLFNLLIGEANATVTTQCRYRCKNGSYRWIEFTAVNLLHDPDIRGVLGNYQDISERMQAEAQLQKSHNLLSNLARLVPGVIYQYRLYPDGRAAIPYASPGMREIFEFSPEEVREDVALLFGRLHPDDHDRVAEAIFESARTLEMFYCEFRVVLPRQGLRWRGAQAKPQRMEDGGTLWHGIISDITERKKNEEERAKLQEQLQQSQKMESVGRLAGGVAHDYNNMLSVILGYTEMALDKVQSQHPLHADLIEILKAATRSSNITRQLLAFARKQTIAPKVVDLNAVVESMLKMLRRLIGEDIDLDWRPGNALWAVKIDPAQLDQILANLCVNARDAIEGVGKVTIETGNTVFDEAYCEVHAGYSVGEYVLLAVSDDGCGMNQEVINNLFEPFFTTKAVTEGTGLGLATIYGIVKQNNGFINVYSEPGQGSTFKIYLPRQTATQRQAGVASQARTPLSRGETVLLVEDEPAIMRMAQMMLRSLGYRVIAAGTPNLAIELAREHGGELSLLLTDVVMPEMNGRDLARQLSALCPGVKTLFMSGYTANVIAHHGVLEEGMAFIQKPFSMNELGVKIRMVLDRQI